MSKVYELVQPSSVTYGAARHIDPCPAKQGRGKKGKGSEMGLDNEKSSSEIRKNLNFLAEC